MSEKQTRLLLRETPKAYHTQINDILLSALARALADWTNANRVLIDLEGHGREIEGPDALFEGIDLSRTVGWFTSMYPVLLTIDDPRPGETLKSVKEQLRRIPDQGLGFDLLRYLCKQEHDALDPETFVHTFWKYRAPSRMAV